MWYLLWNWYSYQFYSVKLPLMYSFFFLPLFWNIQSFLYCSHWNYYWVSSRKIIKTGQFFGVQVLMLVIICSFLFKAFVVIFAENFIGKWSCNLRLLPVNYIKNEMLPTDYLAVVFSLPTRWHFWILFCRKCLHCSMNSSLRDLSHVPAADQTSWLKNNCFYSTWQSLLI